MAFYSQQCVDCTEATKRCAGEYRGKDEAGAYSGSLYQCDNPACKISYERRKTQRQFQTTDDRRTDTADWISPSGGNRRKGSSR